MVTVREEAPVPQPDMRSRTPSLTEKAALPHFITQFKGMKWFDKLFPNANPSVSVTLQIQMTCTIKIYKNIVLTNLFQTFPKPWTIDAFVGLLLIFLSKTPHYDVKQHICAVSKIISYFLTASHIHST